MTIVPRTNNYVWKPVKRINLSTNSMVYFDRSFPRCPPQYMTECPTALSV